MMMLLTCQKIGFIALIKAFQYHGNSGKKQLITAAVIIMIKLSFCKHLSITKKSSHFKLYKVKQDDAWKIKCILKSKHTNIHQV